jgi:predicted DNA binding CopG/RHH family protein
MQSKNKRSVVKKLRTPEFRSEAEEARWYAANQDALLAEFQDAAKESTLGRGTLAKRGLTPTTTIRLDRGDIELAKRQAEQRGLRYQTYLKMLIHQALREEMRVKR